MSPVAGDGLWTVPRHGAYDGLVGGRTWGRALVRSAAVQAAPAEHDEGERSIFEQTSRRPHPTMEW